MAEKEKIACFWHNFKRTTRKNKDGDTYFVCVICKYEMAWYVKPEKKKGARQ